MNKRYRIYLFCAICFYLSAVFWFINFESTTRITFCVMYIVLGTMWLLIARRFKSK